MKLPPFAPPAVASRGKGLYWLPQKSFHSCFNGSRGADKANDMVTFCYLLLIPFPFNEHWGCIRVSVSYRV